MAKRSGGSGEPHRSSQPSMVRLGERSCAVGADVFNKGLREQPELVPVRPFVVAAGVKSIAVDQPQEPTGKCVVARIEPRPGDVLGKERCPAGLFHREN